MTPPYLFDSHALLAFFQNEEGAEIVAEILQRALKRGLDRLICVINLGEIIYVTKRRFGDSKKLEVLARVHQLGLKVLPVPQNLVFKAAEIKAQYPISYADCFALACAMEHSARVVTGDPDFKKIAHLVSIDWIR
jgi:predicted nucleic acid-binding protein